MVSLFLYIVYLIVLIACCILSVLLIALAIAWRKKKIRFLVASASAVAFIVVTCLLCTISVTSAENTNRENSITAFEENFGFNPTNSVKEIKLKNYFMYDDGAHWMAFTYDSIVFNKILRHDQPLTIADFGTQKYEEIGLDLKKSCKNCPDWFQLPNSNVSKIFFKRNFLQHSSSEYYLWVDDKEKEVYLEVFYSD